MLRLSALLLVTSGLYGEYATVAGHRVWYELSGSGPQAVVLVPGWTCDTGIWRYQVPDLARHFRVLAIDLPGHGRSDKPEIRYDMKLFAAAVDAVMRQAGIGRAVLAGFSMGGSVIRQVLEDYPGRVQALVSVDGSVFRQLPSAALQDAEKLIASLRGPDGHQVLLKYIDAFFTDASTPEVRAAVHQSSGKAPMHAALSAIEDTLLRPVWDRVGPAKVPALAIVRETGRPDREAVYRALLPDLEYHVIPGTGHFLHMEKPEEVNRLIIDFVRRRGR